MPLAGFPHLCSIVRQASQEHHAFPEETRAELSPDCIPSPSPDPSYGYCPRSHQCRTKVGWKDQLWWEYSNNNIIHLLQEKLFHQCVSCQLPQRADLALPALRNEWLAMSFFSETFQSSFSDPHTAQKGMWKQ